MVKNITDYGKSIKLRLVELGKSQNWLIDQVHEKTGLFFDSSYLHKVLVGEYASSTIISAINEILGLDP